MLCLFGGKKVRKKGNSFRGNKVRNTLSYVNQTDQSKSFMLVIDLSLYFHLILADIKWKIRMKWYSYYVFQDVDQLLEKRERVGSKFSCRKTTFYSFSNVSCQIPFQTINPQFSSFWYVIRMTEHILYLPKDLCLPSKYGHLLDFTVYIQYYCVTGLSERINNQNCRGSYLVLANDPASLLYKFNY